MTSSTGFSRVIFHHLLSYFWIAVGAFLAAVAVRIFLLPNQLIDGGIVGIALILGRLFGHEYLSYFLVILNIPFVYLAYKAIRRSFVLHMGAGIIFFAAFLGFLQSAPSFIGDPLEIVVIGGAILGIGVGLIIRSGGCLDGTEILAIIINRKQGFTVGQVVLFINVFIFAAYGWIFQDWHIALQSLMTYIVAFKMMDLVIVGLDELKSVLIISSKPKELADKIMNELGLGLTVMHGRGGFSGDAREILFIILERLDLATLKEIVLLNDPSAFIAIENLHEVVYGKQSKLPRKKRPRNKVLNGNLFPKKLDSHK
jgi:uncharacterized membrane-anchored protein YitT (DUF2179 family)